MRGHGSGLRAVRVGRPAAARGYDPDRSTPSWPARRMPSTPTGGRRAIADEVHRSLRKPGLGRGRGYDEDEVDTLLDAVEATLRGGSGARGVGAERAPADRMTWPRRPGRRGAAAAAVVSLVPSLTEAIAATDAGLLVGATDWCTHPRISTSPASAAPSGRIWTGAALDRPRDRQRRGEPGGGRRGSPRRRDPCLGHRAGHRRRGARQPRRLCAALGRPDPLAGRAPACGPIRRGCRRSPPSSRSGVVRGWCWAGTPSPATCSRGSASATSSPTTADRYPRLAKDDPAAVVADLVVFPDEPYAFTPDDGPEAWPQAAGRCSSAAGTSPGTARRWPRRPALLVRPTRRLTPVGWPRLRCQCCCVQRGAVAVLHAAAVLFMLTGSLLALRWPRRPVAARAAQPGDPRHLRDRLGLPGDHLELWLRRARRAGLATPAGSSGTTSPSRWASRSMRRPPRSASTRSPSCRTWSATACWCGATSGHARARGTPIGR